MFRRAHRHPRRARLAEGDRNRDDGASGRGILQRERMRFTVELTQAEARVAEADALFWRETAVRAVCNAAAVVGDANLQSIRNLPRVDRDTAGAGATSDAVLDGVLDERLQNE